MSSLTEEKKAELLKYYLENPDDQPEIVIVRNPTIYKGPGLLRFYDMGELLGEWECITGDDQLSSDKMGGITPSRCEWVPVDVDIRKRQHPRGHYIRGFRIAPVGLILGLNRTFMLDDLDNRRKAWPFWLHPGSRTYKNSSTGCIGIVERWSQFKKTYNYIAQVARPRILIEENENYKWRAAD